MVLHIVLQVTTYKHCNTLVKGHFYEDLYWKGFIDNKYSVKIIVIIILPLRLNHGLFEKYNKWNRGKTMVNKNTRKIVFLFFYIYIA